MAARLLPDELGGERICWALDRVLTDRSLAASAAELRRAAARHDAPAAAVDVLESLVGSWS